MLSRVVRPNVKPGPYFGVVLIKQKRLVKYRQLLRGHHTLLRGLQVYVGIIFCVLSLARKIAVSAVRVLRVLPMYKGMKKGRNVERDIRRVEVEGTRRLWSSFWNIIPYSSIMLNTGEEDTG
jgi:hypothetical protein